MKEQEAEREIDANHEESQENHKREEATQEAAGWDAYLQTKPVRLPLLIKSNVM